MPPQWAAMRIRPPGSLIYAAAQGLIGSLRFHRFGFEHLRRAASLSPTGTAIYCHWHQSLMTLIAPHQRTGIRIAALASLSGDGEIIADYLDRVGIRPVRGSSARGSARAAKELYGALAEGWHVVIPCDGPRGPARQCKEGPLEIARRHRVPVLPLAARASRDVELGSWDRFRIPLPGAHVAVVYGEPILYPPEEPSAEEVTARAAALSRELDRLDDRATALVRRFAPRRGTGAAAVR